MSSAILWKALRDTFCWTVGRDSTTNRKSPLLTSGRRCRPKIKLSEHIYPCIELTLSNDWCSRNHDPPGDDGTGPDKAGPG